MAGPYCLSVIYRVICICWSQTHNPSLPYPLTWQSQVCSLCLWACLCFVDIFICIIFQIPHVSGKFLKNIQMNEWVVGLLQWHKVSWLNDKFSRRWWAIITSRGKEAQLTEMTFPEAEVSNVAGIQLPCDYSSLSQHLHCLPWTKK